MSEKEQIYEIANIVGNDKLFKGDVSSAANIIHNMLSEKYISPIKKAMEQENTRSRKNPSKEARLLSALKPFMPQANHKKLDETLDTIHLLETLRGIQKRLPRPKVQATTQNVQTQELTTDPSVHTDGVYDIDKQCLDTPKSPLIPLFLILIMSNMGRP